MSINSQKLNHLLSQIGTSTFKQIDYATFFIWYLTEVEEKQDATITDIVKCFRESNLSAPNTTILRRNLYNSKDTVSGSISTSFRIHRDALPRFRSQYGALVLTSPPPEKVIRERLDVSKTPFLTSTDIDNAYKMAELYVAIHCLENSVRCLIRNVLYKTLGESWWDKAASEAVRRKVTDRKSRETKNRWLPSRGADELNYVDWSDLVTLIRKYHKEFERFIPDIKFVELRLEELENLRNTIAHNGVLPDDEIGRVELALSDWCKQVSI